jgi:hypothetical protein
VKVLASRSFRIAGWVLLLTALAACGSEDEDDDDYDYDESQAPGSTGQTCNPDAIGTDGCDPTSVCVVQTGVCHADCAQEACSGKCSDYFSPIVKATLSVCFSETEAVPGQRTPANPHR